MTHKLKQCSRITAGVCYCAETMVTLMLGFHQLSVYQSSAYHFVHEAKCENTKNPQLVDCVEPKC